MTKLGIVWMPRSAREAVELARLADDAGFWGLGVCDSPILYAELYPVITECLANTASLKVGPNVTNPVSRHWTTHGAAARTLEELRPGRFFLGIGPGDGAVHTVGLRPSKVQDLEHAIRDITEASPAAVPIYAAAGGPRSVAMAGRAASGVIIGTGGDATAVRSLADRARAARAAAGITDPFEVWALVVVNVTESETDTRAMRRAVAPAVIGNARNAFDHTWEDKNVPTELRRPMQERLANYRFMHHAVVGDENPNVHLFDDRPDVLDYLLDRFTIIGTPEWSSRRLSSFVEESGVDGIWMSVVGPDPAGALVRAADAFADHLSPASRTDRP